MRNYTWLTEAHSLITLLKLKRVEGNKFSKSSSWASVLYSVVCVGLIPGFCRLFDTFSLSTLHYLKTFRLSFCKHHNISTKKIQFPHQIHAHYCLTRSAVLNPAAILSELITLFEDAARKGETHLLLIVYWSSRLSHFVQGSTRLNSGLGNGKSLRYPANLEEPVELTSAWVGIDCLNPCLYNCMLRKALPGWLSMSAGMQVWKRIRLESHMILKNILEALVSMLMMLIPVALCL